MLANLRALFGVIVDIVLLRRGPENIPASSTLLSIVVAVYAALYMLAFQVFIVSAIVTPPGSWALQVACALAFQLLWFRFAFQIVGKPERFVQTMTAIFATSTLFIPSLALIGALLPYTVKGVTAEPPALLVLSIVFVWIWMIAILIRIVRAAFEWNWPSAFVFILAANFIPMILLSLLFGDSPKPG